MSTTTGGPKGGRIESESVRGLTRWIFLAAALVFLVTIGLGFLNAVTTGTIPRWQSLTHLHSGTVGFILLSFVGVAVWLFAGERSADPSFVRRLRWLVGLAVLAFVGLVASFAYGFSQGGAAMTPLGIFAPFAAMIVWAVAVFALLQLRHVVATTARLLVAVGLLLAAVGATVGAWLGLNHAFGGAIPTPPEQAIGAHFLTVLPAVAVVSTGVLEWLVRDDTAERWSRAGLAQAGIGGVTGLVFPFAFVLLLLGVPESTLQPMLMGLLVGGVLFTLVYLGRTGWRALRTNPLGAGTASWTFFGTLWFVVFLPSILLSPLLGDPEWTSVLSIHAFFVGFVANTLFGVYSARTSDVSVRYAWTEPTAMWLVNLGIVVFVALVATLEVSHGAMVMGAGLLLGVATMVVRLQDDRSGLVSGESGGEGVPE